MPQADPEHRHPPQNLANRLHRIVHRLRIARPVRKKHPIRLQLEHILRTRLRRNHRHAAALARQHPQNVMLDPKVISHHMKALPRFFVLDECIRQAEDRPTDSGIVRVERVNRLRRNHACQVRPIHLADVPRPLHQRRLVVGLRVEITPRITPYGPQMPNQRPRIDLRQHRNRIPLHVLVRHLLRTPVRADGRELAHDQTLDIGLGRLVVCQVRSVIANLGICENDDLSGIGRIGGDFLITGKGSIKNDFALAFARCP